MNDWIKVEDFNFDQNITDDCVVFVCGDEWGDSTKGNYYASAVILDGKFYEIITLEDGSTFIRGDELIYVKYFCFVYNPLTNLSVTYKNGNFL